MSRFISSVGLLLGIQLTVLGAASPTSAADEFIREAFHRVFVSPEQFKATIRSYMAATQGRCSMYFPYPDKKLDLAAVSSPKVSFLILAGEDAALERFRSTAVTFHVYSLTAALQAAHAAGAATLQERTTVPTGVQARVEFPDGLIVEYVEHNEQAKRFYTCEPLHLDN